MPASSASCLLRAVSFGRSAYLWSLSTLTFMAIIRRIIAGGRCPLEFLPMGKKPALKTDPELGCLDPKQGLVSKDMTDSIYDFVIDRLEKTKGQWPLVSEESGISRRTIEKIARKEVKDPGVSLIERLARYFREKDLN